MENINATIATAADKVEELISTSENYQLWL